MNEGIWPSAAGNYWKGGFLPVVSFWHRRRWDRLEGTAQEQAYTSMSSPWLSKEQEAGCVSLKKILRAVVRLEGLQRGLVSQVSRRMEGGGKRCLDGKPQVEGGWRGTRVCVCVCVCVWAWSRATTTKNAAGIVIEEGIPLKPRSRQMGSGQRCLRSEQNLTDGDSDGRASRLHLLEREGGFERGGNQCLSCCRAHH